MRTLLFLNGPKGWQTGIEDGFLFLKEKSKIEDLKWFYFEAYMKINGIKETLSKILDLSNSFQPDLIVFFHISSFSITKSFIQSLKNLKTKPLIVYDEGDMYGGWSKPITSSMKIILKYADVISIRGLGKWYETVKKYNKKIIYTPHSNSLFRITKSIIPNQNKKDKLVFIGNRIISRLGKFHRLQGAGEREKLVKEISRNFPTEFKLYGKGWKGITNSVGVLDFHKQADVCANSLLQVSYEHYPNIPYYFSDRLPIALASGQIYVCHYHEGYENIFKGCDFIYFFKTIRESVDIIKYILSLDTTELNKKSLHAKAFADSFLSPEIVWSNFFRNVKSFPNREYD